MIEHDDELPEDAQAFLAWMFSRLGPAELAELRQLRAEKANPWAIAREAQVAILLDLREELNVLVNACPQRTATGLGWRDGMEEAIQMIDSRLSRIKRGEEA